MLAFKMEVEVKFQKMEYKYVKSVLPRCLNEVNTMIF